MLGRAFEVRSSLVMTSCTLPHWLRCWSWGLNQLPLQVRATIGLLWELIYQLGKSHMTHRKARPSIVWVCFVFVFLFLMYSSMRRMGWENLALIRHYNWMWKVLQLHSGGTNGFQWTPVICLAKVTFSKFFGFSKNNIKTQAELIIIYVFFCYLFM